MANRVSNEQMEELLDFLAEHPALAKGVGLGARSKEAVDKQWNDLANKLNSYGSGSTKSGERWKKYWADLKHKSKTRLAKRRRDAMGTGGGPSSQDDLSEVDKKILAIIGEQAVFGDSVHKVPIFNIETETQNFEIGPESENIVSQQIVHVQVHNSETEDIHVLPRSPPVVNSPSRRGQTSRNIETETQNFEIGPESENIVSQQIVHVQVHNSETEDIHVLPRSPPVVNSPSRRGQTSRVFTDNTIEIDPEHNITDTVRQQPTQTGVESPVSRPIADRPRLRRNRPNTANPSRINPDWVIELERKRVEAEDKLANAALIMAEASRVQAETARTQADLTRVFVELIRRQSDDIKALLEMMRSSKQ